MKILVIDGQGGKLGAQIIGLIKSKNYSNIEIIGVGTNAMASEAFLKAKADVVATGENPVIVCARDADIIIGPIGIVIADSLYGEITPKMAIAVGQSNAKKILIPINKCDNLVAGITDLSTAKILEDVILKLKGMI